MKKLIALTLSLLMLCGSTVVMAEEAAVEDEVYAYTYDPTNPDNVEGEFMALEELGLKLIVPTGFIEFDLTEEQLAAGSLINFGREDGSVMVSVGIAPVTDAEGNLIETATDLYNLYSTTEGIAYAEYAYNNDIEVVMYQLDEAGAVCGNCYVLDEGNVLAFNVGVSDPEADANVTATILGSIMAIEETDILGE